MFGKPKAFLRRKLEVDNEDCKIIIYFAVPV